MHCPRQSVVPVRFYTPSFGVDPGHIQTQVYPEVSQVGGVAQQSCHPLRLALGADGLAEGTCCADGFQCQPSSLPGSRATPRACLPSTALQVRLRQ